MRNSKSSRQLINAELAIRGANDRIKRVMQEHTPREEQDGLTIDFYCECSEVNCGERVKLSLEAYEQLHDDQSKFVIAKGHGTPRVEKVVKTGRNLQIVEKFAL